MASNLLSINHSNIEIKLQKATSGKKQSGIITVKLTSQEVKKIMITNSKQMKIKLPLKLKLSNDNKDIKQLSKISARLVLQQEDTNIRQDGGEDKEQKNIINDRSQVQQINKNDIPYLLKQVSQPSQVNSLIPIQQNGDLFLEVEQHVDQTMVSKYKNVNDFLRSIIQQINNHSIYGILMNRQIIVNILQKHGQAYFNFEQTQQLLQIVFEYMSISKNEVSQYKIKTNLQCVNFAQTIGRRWYKLYEQIYISNKNILKILDYIEPKIQNEGSRYTHCYLDLKFDFSGQEIYKVSQAVKYQCRYNHKSFCFLTNYLLKCCYTMQQNNSCIKQIQDTLLNVITKLIKYNPSSKGLQGNDQVILRHSNYQIDKNQYPFKYLVLKNIPKQKKVETLELFISQRAKQAQKNSHSFSQLIKDVCSKEGSNFNAGVKIKSMRKRRAIDRVKQKILDKISSKHRSQILLSTNPNVSVDEYTQGQFEQYKHHLNSIFISLEDTIQFGVDDLLRGRCIFSSLDKLNACCDQIKIEINKRGFKLLALLNRLKQKTCDIILHIQIGETIAQLQLVINYKLVQNQFNYKLNYLKNAQFYNHITHLKLYNQKLAYLFLEEAYRFINSNQKFTIDYHEKTDYKRSKSNLEKFINLLPFKVDHSEIDLTQCDIGMLSYEIQQFKAIKQALIPLAFEPNFELNKFNGDFCYQTQNYQDSQKFEELYCKQVEAKYHDVISKIGTGYKFTEDQKKILKYYAGAVNTLGKIYMHNKVYIKAIEKLEYSQKIIKIIGDRDDHITETLANLGQIEYKRGNIDKSITIYNNLIQFLAQSKEKNQQQTAKVFINLALVYKHQGNYFQSLKLFKKSLEILKQLKGKQHILLAGVYNHLGAVYNLQGNLAQSLINYKQSLEIIEKQKGKNSFDCASVLGNIGLIFQTDSSYYDAIEYYERSAYICSKHNIRGIIYANSNYGLGKCYSAIKNYGKAIEYYKKSLQYFRKQKSQMFYSNLNDIAVAYESVGDDETANYYYNSQNHIEIF